MAPADSAVRHVDLHRSYGAVRSLTELLAAPLGAEDQTVQSMPDVSPTKWHRGHTTWFFETFVLGPHAPGYRVHHPAYGYIFNSYYEAVGPRHPRAERGLVSRPGIEEVAAYRRHVDAAMDCLLSVEQAPDVLDLVELGVHHEQQHDELLLMDIKHVLSCSPLHPAYSGPRDAGESAGGVAGTPPVAPWPPASSAQAAPTAPVPPEAPGSGAADPRKPGWIEHQGGVVEVGHAGASFSFDNETPRHPVLHTPFALGDRPVTNGEWLAFVDDGGYDRPELWLSDGWAAVQANHWDGPLYWADEGDGFRVFTLAGDRPLEPSEPVCHVSYYEADAFARWSGARLPTEQEWETVASELVARVAPTCPYRLQPAALTEGSAGLFGTVWQWTSTAYSAYPGFRPAGGAVGEYNGKFMVNQQVLRGSACITPPGHARLTYRNFFPPSARWAYSGVRLARDL